MKKQIVLTTLFLTLATTLFLSVPNVNAARALQATTSSTSSTLERETSWGLTRQLVRALGLNFYSVWT